MMRGRLNFSEFLDIVDKLCVENIMEWGFKDVSVYVDKDDEHEVIIFKNKDWENVGHIIIK